MFQRIIVPLDGSPFAESALSIACDLARHFESEIIAVTVLQPAYLELTGDAYDAAIIERVRQSSFQEQSMYLENKVSELKAQKYKISGRMIDSSGISSSLLNLAETESADLIVMTTHGRSGLSRWTLGSVTERVLRHATCPVLAIRENVEIKHIMIALDGSELSEAVLKPSLELAKGLGARVSLLRVDDKPVVLDTATLRDMDNIEPGMANLLVAQEYNRAQNYVEQIAARYADEGVPIEVWTVTDTAANGILNMAATKEADVIAMSTHGRTGLRRWVYGSVTEKVLRAAQRPLFIVRPEQEEE